LVERFAKPIAVVENMMGIAEFIIGPHSAFALRATADWSCDPLAPCHTTRQQCSSRSADGCLRLGRRGSLIGFAISFEVTGMRSVEKIAVLRLADPHSSIHARNRTADDP
jgi:hypothetical protein